MAGNFMKYGAAEASFGSKNAGDIPVDSHQLIALCAPRLTFISYGIPETGDANWLDQQGSFMAAVAAGPVFRLLGAKDLGTSDDYMKEKKPAVNVSLLDGQLAWRQHDGGHTDGPNWKYFIPWANKLLEVHAAMTPAAARGTTLPASCRTLAAVVATASVVVMTALAVRPRRPAAVLRPISRRRAPTPTRSWRIPSCWPRRRRGASTSTSTATRSRGDGARSDYPELLANWKENFFGWNAADFGWGADRTENILWRLDQR